ncbi:MAG: apolipoprotein N-acyltransferase [Planctomycetia bacterium]|nr:apolipoprotein N-acyltransferase [Planctomycetia bacterium]
MQSVPAIGWCLLSSILFWCSFFPLNAGWLGWIALIPLGWVLQQYVSDAPVNRWYQRPVLSAWLAGFVFCLLAFQWIRLASEPMYAVYIVLALIISLQWYFFFLFSKLLVRSLHVPFILAASISWTALEYIRSQIWIGYAWYYLGHTQHDELYFIQAADLVGVFGLSFMVMLINMALARVTQRRTLGSVCSELAPAIVLVGVASWYGSIQIMKDAGQFTREQTPRIAVLQGNQPQYLRNDPELWKTIDETYVRLGNHAASYQPELIIAPETCLSITWIRPENDKLPAWAVERFPRLPVGLERCRAWASHYASQWKADLLFGFNVYDFKNESMKHTNSALLIDRQGNEKAHYDKIVCLPFGEYIPWADTLPFMKWLSPYEYEYTIKPGNKVTSLPWKQYRIAPLICYEDTVPHLTRSYMMQENPHFFVNISNDGWFKGSEEHEEHLVCARFRCIEHRRSMVRSVNMGISCIIDALGRVIALPAHVPSQGEQETKTGAIPVMGKNSSSWSEAKAREGVLIGSIPIYSEFTVYTVWGDVLPLACWLFICLAFCISIFIHLKRRHGSATATAANPV